MKKRTFAWIGISILILVSVIGGAWAFFGKTEITMTQAELQAKIDEKMPFTTESGITFSSVQLDLTDNKIALAVEASGTKLSTDFSAAGRTKGSLRYNNGRGSFHFHPDELEITSIEANGEGLEEHVSERITGFIDKWVDSPKINANSDELAALGADFANDAIHAAAEFTLSRVPVYTLPDDLKGNVVRMFLKDVEVRGENEIVAHLSLWQFTKMVMLYIVAFIAAIGMTFALIRNPGWGAAAIVLSSLDT